MLFFIKVEKNRMIPITSMDPINAPIMTEIKPDKVNTPAVIVPAPASMTRATPRLAPELMPKMEGSARGLLKVVCNISPDEANAIPQSKAVTACGRRDSQTIKLQLAFSTSLPVRICHRLGRDVYRTEQQVGSCQCKDEEEQYDTVFRSFILQNHSANLVKYFNSYPSKSVGWNIFIKSFSNRSGWKGESS